MCVSNTIDLFDLSIFIWQHGDKILPEFTSIKLAQNVNKLLCKHVCRVTVCQQDARRLIEKSITTVLDSLHKMSSQYFLTLSDDEKKIIKQNQKNQEKVVCCLFIVSRRHTKSRTRLSFEPKNIGLNRKQTRLPI